jgi:hypothetical protein
MPSQTILKATIPDVEAALIEQYGRIHVRQKAQSSTHGVWIFRASRRQSGKCTANLASGGATITMSCYTPLWLWAIIAVLTCIGLLLFVIPGLAIIVVTIVRLTITSAALNIRFPKMVENVNRIIAARLNATPQPPVIPKAVEQQAV